MTSLDKLNRRLVREQAERWRGLQAWQGTCLTVPVAVTAPRLRLLGCAYPHRIELCIRPGQSLAETFRVLLHEFAHVAAGLAAQHERPWRERFAAAATEVTGEPVDPAPNCLHVVDEQVDAALRRWIARSC